MIARLRPKLAKVTGVSMFLNPVQDLRMGGRSANSTYQYTLKSDSSADLKLWAGKLAEAMKAQPGLTDVDTDQAENGVETFVTIDKDSIARLGIKTSDVDNALYNAFGQRQVANIYDELNQYHVIMGVAQKYAQTPEALRDVYVPAKGSASVAAGTTASATASTTTATASATTTTATNITAARDPSSGSAIASAVTRMVPLSAISTFAESATATSVNHQDGETGDDDCVQPGAGYQPVAKPGGGGAG